MTTPAIAQTRAAQSSAGFGNFKRICVATNLSDLAERFREGLAPAEVVIHPSLADLMIQTECDLYVVDLKVRDMRLWPAPILSEPAAHRPWLFLITSAGDLGQVSRFPTNCLVFERKASAFGQLVKQLHSLADPESTKRLTGVDYLDRPRSFLARFDNGAAYMLAVGDLPEADGSRVVRTKLSGSRHYFSVDQESGNSFEVPWDEVLYHCEATYPFYKGHGAAEQAENRSKRIGERVRTARESKGLTVSELADRTGIKRPNVSRLEHGRHVPSLETLERIADALEVPVAGLVAIG